jgi:hypothetical protein
MGNMQLINYRTLEVQIVVGVRLHLADKLYYMLKWCARDF